MVAKTTLHPPPFMQEHAIMAKSRNIMVFEKRRRRLAKKRELEHAEWEERTPGWNTIALTVSVLIVVAVVSMSNEPNERMMHLDRVGMLAERNDGIAGASPMSGTVFR